jgi:hypothetical protein
MRLAASKGGEGGRGLYGRGRDGGGHGLDNVASGGLDGTLGAVVCRWLARWLGWRRLT